jgi:hypothetical protein
MKALFIAIGRSGEPWRPGCNRAAYLSWGCARPNRGRGGGRGDTGRCRPQDLALVSDLGSLQQALTGLSAQLAAVGKTVIGPNLVTAADVGGS